MQGESQPATKHDVLALRQDLDALRAEMVKQSHELQRELSGVTREIYVTASGVDPDDRDLSWLLDRHGLTANDAGNTSQRTARWTEAQTLTTNVL